MTDADKILKMIEEVDPADTNKLDEIDARVWCFLNDRFDFERVKLPLRGRYTRYKKNSDNGDPTLYIEAYTRSRDALKSIRPDGMWFCVYQDGGGFGCGVELENSFIEIALVEDMKTEELAELYAVIQAIQYERESK